MTTTQKTIAKPIHHLFALSCLVISSVLCLYQLSAQNAPQKPQPKVKIESSGYTTISGITYTNDVDRDAAFQKLAATGYTNGIIVPHLDPKNEKLAAKVTATLTAASKAGILPKTDTKAPGKYE